MTFWEHLEELRKRIIYSIVYIVLFSSMLYYFSPVIIEYLTKPVGKTYFFSPPEAIFIRIKVAIATGILVALPFILHQIWLFLVPALEKKERKYGFWILFFTVILFYSGFGVSIWLFLPYITRVLISFGGDVMTPIMGITKYLGYVLWMSGGVALSFEMPVVVFFLTQLGILSARDLLSKWKYVLIIVLFISAVITPTIDIVTQILVASPMFFLYLISTLVAFIFGR